MNEFDKRMLQWARTAARTAADPVLPADIAVVWHPVIQFHFPVWSQMYNLVYRNRGPLPPVRAIRSLIQYYYSKTKHRVGRVDSDAEYVLSGAKKLCLGWEQTMWLSRFIDRVIDCAKVWQIILAMRKVRENQQFVSLDEFRNRCNRSCSIAKFGCNLMRQLAAESWTLLARSISPPVPTSHSHSTDYNNPADSLPDFLNDDEIQRARQNLHSHGVKNKRKAIILDANSNDAVKRVRLCHDRRHSPIEIENAGRNGRVCILCGKR